MELNPDDKIYLQQAVQLLEFGSPFTQVLNNFSDNAFQHFFQQEMEEKIQFALNAIWENPHHPTVIPPFEPTHLYEKVRQANISTNNRSLYALTEQIIKIPPTLNSLFDFLRNLGKNMGYIRQNSLNSGDYWLILALDGNRQKEQQSHYYAMKEMLQENEQIAHFYTIIRTKLLKKLNYLIFLYSSTHTQKSGSPLTVLQQHYQKMAIGHLAVKTLEQKYPTDVVKNAYLQYLTEI